MTRCVTSSLLSLSPPPEVGGPAGGGAEGDQVPEGVGEQPGEEDHQAGGAHRQHGCLGGHTHLAASGRLIGWRGGRGGVGEGGGCLQDSVSSAATFQRELFLDPCRRTVGISTR